MKPLQLPQSAEMMAAAAVPLPTPRKTPTTTSTGWNTWDSTSFYTTNPSVAQNNVNVYGSNHYGQPGAQLVYNADPNAYAQDQFTIWTPAPVAQNTMPSLTDTLAFAQLQHQKLQCQQLQIQQQAQRLQQLQSLQQLQQMKTWNTVTAANGVNGGNVANGTNALNQVRGTKFQIPKQQPSRSEEQVSSSSTTAAAPASPSTVAATVARKTRVESM